MSNIADTMLELLLFPMSDSRWVNIFHDQEQSGAPKVEERRGRAVFYHLPKLGVMLSTDGNWVLNIHFFVRAPYSGDLPFGLKPGFSKTDVRQLLGNPLTVSNPDSDGFWNESYHIDAYRVWIWYSPVDERLDNISVFRTGEK